MNEVSRDWGDTEGVAGLRLFIISIIESGCTDIQLPAHILQPLQDSALVETVALSLSLEPNSVALGCRFHCFDARLLEIWGPGKTHR